MCVSNSLNPVQLVTILQIYLHLEGNWYWTFYLLTSAVCSGQWSSTTSTYNCLTSAYNYLLPTTTTSQDCSLETFSDCELRGSNLIARTYEEWFNRASREGYICKKRKKIKGSSGEYRQGKKIQAPTGYFNWRLPLDDWHLTALNTNLLKLSARNCAGSNRAVELWGMINKAPKQTVFIWRQPINNIANAVRLSTSMLPTL